MDGLPGDVDDFSEDDNIKEKSDEVMEGILEAQSEPESDTEPEMLATTTENRPTEVLTWAFGAESAFPP